MELKGKIINVIGDSVTEGCCATTPELGYVGQLKDLCGLSCIRNYGIGATRIARQQHPMFDMKRDQDFCLRYSRMDPNADVVLVFGGTNDHGHGDAPFGTPDDRTPETFCGACHFLFSGLKEMYPDSTIVVMTPLHRVEEMLPKEPGGQILEDYVTVIRDTANQYQLHVLDLFETSAIKAHIPQIAEKLTTDGLHPNDEGHRILAEEIKAYLEAL